MNSLLFNSFYLQKCFKIEIIVKANIGSTKQPTVFDIDSYFSERFKEQSLIRCETTINLLGTIFESNSICWFDNGDDVKQLITSFNATTTRDSKFDSVRTFSLSNNSTIFEIMQIKSLIANSKQKIQKSRIEKFVDINVF